jgi:hypothetical protein
MLLQDLLVIAPGQVISLLDEFQELFLQALLVLQSMLRECRPEVHSRHRVERLK